MKVSHRKTKIVATLGPASNSEETIRDLINAGANVFRLNFSHGSHESHRETIGKIRTISEELNIPVAVLQDLSGPKIRITAIDSNFLELKDGDTCTLKHGEEPTTDKDHIYVAALDPAKTLEVGQSALFADGIIAVEATKVEKDCVECKILKGGSLRSRVGIAFPESNIDLPATTEKDLIDLDWGIANLVDFIAISFVKDAEDVKRVKNTLISKQCDAKIIAKIEVRKALENIDSILEVANGLMVARGDLGVELPMAELPLIQKDLISKANHMGKPVIVATQMLHSMVTSIRPTRAEVVDCAFAVMSGADAVMLSEETAVGQNPVTAVTVLGDIAKEAERSFTFEEYKLRLRDSDQQTVPDAVAYAACAAAVKVGASAIIACTETGTTARLVAKYRPQQPLYGVSRSRTTIRRMCLAWGVQPIPCVSSTTHADEIQTALKEVQDVQDLPNGSLAVITSGLSVGEAGGASVINIKEMNFKE